MADLGSTTGAVTGLIGAALLLGFTGAVLGYGERVTRGIGEQPRKQRRRSYDDYYNYNMYSYEEPRPKKGKATHNDDIYNWENYV